MTTKTSRPTKADHVYLSVTEAGEFLNTGERFIRRLTDERRIAFYKMGSRVRIAKTDLIEFANRGRIEAEQ